MAINEKDGGTQTATLGTEHVLMTTGDPGVYQFQVGLQNMTSLDDVELRIETAVRASSGRQTVFFGTYAHEQGDDGALAIAPPIPTPFYFEVTLLQNSGVGKDYIWSVYDYGNA